MDPAIASVTVAAIATTGTIAVALINAVTDRDKAVARAVEPLRDLIERLRARIRDLGGHSDDIT